MNRRNFLDGVTGAAVVGPTLTAQTGIGSCSAGAAGQSDLARRRASGQLPLGDHPAGRVAASPVADSGRRAHRSPRRVLARRRPQSLVRRRGRGLGAGAVLARWRHSSRLATSRHGDAGAHHEVRRPHRHAPARRRLVRARTPLDAVATRYDMWAILLANKVLAQYHEATGDARVLEAVTRSLRAMAAGLSRTPLYDWGRFRWYEGLVPIFHVYERTPGAVAARPGADAADARRGLLPRVRLGRHRHPDAAPRPVDLDPARRQSRDGHQGGRALLATRSAS